MNRRLCAWVGSILGSVCLAGYASGQDLPVGLPPGGGANPNGGISFNAYGAADETPYIGQINSFLKDQLTALTGSDPAAASAAREKLKGAVPRGSTPAYYSAVAKSWVSQCAAVLAKTTPLGVRLNIAIVTEDLANVGQVVEVQPLVLQLLNDREPVIAWWGIKAARPLIAVLVLNSPAGVVPAPVTQSKLPDAVVAAVKKCGKSDLSGFATVDAYAALTLKGNISGKTPQQLNPLLPPLVKPVLDILDYRVAQHAVGQVQSPGAERDIGTWLSGVYPYSTPADQKRTVQLLVNLETYAGQRADLYQNNKKEIAQVRTMIMYVASGLKVIGGSGDPMKPLSKLTTLSPSATPAEILQGTSSVFATMQLVFAKLTQPPAIAAISPPPLATTRPTAPVGP